MKKSVKILVAIVLAIMVVIAIVAIAGILKFNFTDSDIYMEKGGRLDSKDATYMIDGQSITLKNGVSELEEIPGSASKIITRYFGNDAFGDLNGDGKDDVAFILTQETGGSGTFFYIAAALSGDKGYNGLNAVLLGDRIAPQTTEIKEGKITANYADRRADESMAASPSVGVSRYFKVVNNQLVEMNEPTQITNKSWKWMRTEMNNDEIITPKKSDAFSITFKDDGSFNGTTDCNNFFGKYEILENKITFSSMGSTRMFCQDSQEDIFMKELGEIESYFINQDNNLIFQIKFDSGSMIFEAPVQMANPASTNCIKLGGKLEIQKRGDGGEYGLCYFEDNRACEEWALMRGDCPEGGVKTTGFDTIEQKYCAWLGGKTLAVPNSICTLKDGSKCSTIDFYEGKCPSTTSTENTEAIFSATFNCSDNKNIRAVFFDDKVELALSDGRMMLLPRAISASGARYANTDESFVFWNKGNTAFVEENDKMTFSDCLTSESN